MKASKTHRLSRSQKKQLYDLWNCEYPARLSYSRMNDFDSYLDSLQDVTHYLLYEKNGRIEGWAFTFIRESSVWCGLIITHKSQGKGKGAYLMSMLKQDNGLLSGWAIDGDSDLKNNGEPYLSPMGFYIRKGFCVMKGSRLETENISAVKILWTR